VHLPDRVSLGHLLGGRSPGRPSSTGCLRGHDTLVPHAVAVFDGAGQHVGDRLDAAVGVPREAGQVIRRNVIAEVIEEEERVEIGGVAEAERAAQMDARSFECRLGLGRPA